MKNDHVSTPEWDSFLAILETNKRFWLTTHQNPDGDGLGSQLALWGILSRMGKEVRIINPNPLPARYAVLGEHARFEVYSPEHHDTFLEGTDVAVLLDAAALSRVGPLEEWFRKCPVRACIDHHPPIEPQSFHWYLADTSAAATGQLVYEGIRAMGFNGDAVIALGAYVALVTDTGSFRFSNSNSRAHRLAAELLEFGINPAEVFDCVFGNWELPRLRLLGHTLTHALVEEEGRLIVMPVSMELLSSLGAGPEDTEGLVDLARNVGDCEVVACLLEQESDVRVSLRSKGRLDVSVIAKALGGGGHPYASGARTQGSLEEVTLRVITMMGAAFSEAGAKGD